VSRKAPRSAGPKEASTRGDTTRARRIEIAKKGPHAFALVYLPHLLQAQNDIFDKDPEKHDDAVVLIEAGTQMDPAEFHLDIYDRFNTPKAKKRREAYIAPRGFAKSTVVTILVLWLAAMKFREFVVWTSDTASQVEELLATFIDEIEGNTLLTGDFPHLLPKKDDRGQYVKFNDRDIVLSSDFRLSARGAAKATRGLRRGSKRPDLFICDDAEGEDSTGKTQYPKRRRWLTRVVAPALAPGGDILWLCTLIDWVSVTGALIRGDEDWTQSWNVHHLQAEWYEDEDGRKVDVATLLYQDTGEPFESGVENDPFVGLTHRLLWADYWPLERLVAFKDENGSLAYSFEMLNKPMAEGDKVFAEGEWLKFAQFENGRIYREDKERGDWINETLLRYITFIDPAFGGKDYAAVVTVGVFQHDFFVREAWWARGDGIRTSQVEEAVRQALHWGSSVIGVESVAAQILLADEFIRVTRIPIEKVSPGSKSKVDRALPVAIRASQGHVYFESGIPSVRALRELLLRFPGPEIDDPVDAFVYAIETGASVRARYMVAS
jgi:hypothetical protein